jgi:hypothetical protein
MSQKLAYDGQTEPAAGPETSVGVAQIVKANPFEASAPHYRLPWTFQVSPWVRGISTGDDIGAKSINSRYYGKCRRVEDDGLLTSLRVCKKQQSPVRIYLVPSEVQDFAQATTGEQQKPYSGCGEGVDSGEAVVRLRQMLRREFRFVYMPGDALRLGLSDCQSKPFKLFACQEALSWALPKLLDPARRIYTLGDHAAALPEGAYMLPITASTRFA